MGIFDLLAEARIREWQERSPEQKKKEAEAALVLTGTEPMEVQLFKEIIQLLQLAGKTTDEHEQQVMQADANKLQIQLMEVLEQSNRPLAAQQVSENIRKFMSEISD